MAAEPAGAGRERQIKGHDAARYCDVCKALKGYQSGELTAPEALAQAGWDRANPAQRPLLLEMFGLPEPPGARWRPPRPAPAPPEPAPLRPVPEPRPIAAAEAAEIDALVDGLIAGWRVPALTARPPPAPEPNPSRNPSWRPACEPAPSDHGNPPELEAAPR